jgi:prevent-host-death family protein
MPTRPGGIVRVEVKVEGVAVSGSTSRRGDAGVALIDAPPAGIILTIILLRRGVAMPKTLPISEVKARLPELVAGVQEREEEVVVTRNGRPAAVLLNIDEYERLKATIDVLSDPELMRQIRASQKFYASGRKGLSFEAVFGESLPPRTRRGRG